MCVSSIKLPSLRDHIDQRAMGFFLAGGATLALNIPEFCPVSCKSPECPYRCTRDWKDGGEVPNTQQQRCGVLLVFLCLETDALIKKAGASPVQGEVDKLRTAIKIQTVELQPLNFQTNSPPTIG